jgi:hypothetical protein
LEQKTTSVTCGGEMVQVSVWTCPRHVKLVSVIL